MSEVRMSPADGGIHGTWGRRKCGIFGVFGGGAQGSGGDAESGVHPVR
jgi:hypothetical protein